MGGDQFQWREIRMNEKKAKTRKKYNRQTEKLHMGLFHPKFQEIALYFKLVEGVCFGGQGKKVQSRDNF